MGKLLYKGYIMGRPTNEVREQRSKIIELGLFVRDSYIYTNFENLTRDFPTHRLNYVFCKECSARDYMNNIEVSELINLKPNIDSIEITKKLEELEKLDDFLSTYYYTLYKNQFNHDKQFPLKAYTTDTIIESKHIINVLGNNPPYDNLSTYTSLNSLAYKMPKEDRKKLLEYCIKYGLGETCIYREMITSMNLAYYDMPNIELKNDNLHRVKIELDLTKPTKEILKYIEAIKNDYDKDPSNIPTLSSLLGADTSDNKLCKTKEFNIYDRKSKKPINGRLADILFIYDCRKAGLNDEYIRNEINRYWQDVKELFSLFENKFGEKTLIKYSIFSQKYIDKQEYKSFVSGYDLSK